MKHLTTSIKNLDKGNETGTLNNNISDRLKVDKEDGGSAYFYKDSSIFKKKI